jgi:DNA-binding transcriptional ArsR family regulator
VKYRSHKVNTMKDLHLCFETLANPLRTSILSTLQNGPMNVTQLVATLEVERTRVSQSLKILRNCSFVNVEKRGKERIYKLNGESILHKAEQGNKGIFHIIQEHKENNCITCHKTCGVHS